MQGDPEPEPYLAAEGREPDWEARQALLWSVLVIGLFIWMLNRDWNLLCWAC